MSTGVVRWEDPQPLSPHDDGNLDEIVKELRANPDRWAVVSECPANLQGKKEIARLFAAISSGRRRFVADDNGKFVATTRTVQVDEGHKIIRLHARYCPIAKPLSMS